MSQTAPTHFKRLLRWTLISLGVHAALILVTSIGYFISLAKGPPPAEPAKAEAKPGAAAAAPASDAPPAAAADKPAAAGADGLPPVPKSKDADAAYFGKPETDPTKLHEGPDNRPDLDALK